MMLRMRRELLATTAVEEHHGSLSEIIDSVVILERRSDLVTPLLTQLTFEGLIDETLGIKSCKLSI